MRSKPCHPPAESGPLDPARAHADRILHLGRLAGLAKRRITQFRDVFQPDQGIFSPGYPLVPPEPERVRLWDFPVGYNTIYTPRAYEAIGFDELRALAESHDITRLAIETRKDQIEKLEWMIKSRDERQAGADAASASSS